MMHLQDAIGLHVIIVALAPLQCVSVFWYVRCLDRYPNRLVKRVLPWVLMMAANIVVPFDIFLSNRQAKTPDIFLTIASLVEGIVFLGLLFYLLYLLRKRANSRHDGLHPTS